MELITVEDWLCYMSGWFDGSNDKSFSHPVARPISLATYDARFVESVTSTILQGKGLTDKQVELAVKIITKYQRQWQKLGVDPSYLLTQDIPLRMPIREIDRTSSIWIHDKRIYVKFPYNQRLINDLHAAAEQACGMWEFNRDEKTWEIDLVERNIAILTLLPGFDLIEWGMDAESHALISQAKLLRKHPPALPTIDYVDGEMRLLNVVESAIDSMSKHGWKPDGDPIKCGMLAVNHGITLSQSMLERFAQPASLLRLLNRISMERTFLEQESDSAIGIEDLAVIMEALPDVTFAFVYDKNRLHLMQDKTEAFENDKLYLTPNVMDDIDNHLDLRNTIVVFDWPYTTHMSEVLKGKVLGILNMIPDDRKRNARV